MGHCRTAVLMPISVKMLFSALEEIRTPNLLIRSSKSVCQPAITGIYKRCPIVPLNWEDGGIKLTSSDHHSPLLTTYANAMVLTAVLTSPGFYRVIPTRIARYRPVRSSR
jgi:hypothetical protein